MSTETNNVKKVTVAFNSSVYDSEGYYYKGRLRVSLELARRFVRLLQNTNNRYKVEGDYIFLTLTSMELFRKFAVENKLDVDLMKIAKPMNYYLYVEGLEKVSKGNTGGL